jgi:levanbiose-producing levanase
MATVALVAADVAVPFALTSGGAPPDQSLRAGYHLTPPANWLSDPQRPIYANGKYHLYYLAADQNNGQGGWRHATTTDNVVFKDEGIAIPKATNFPVWTGSGVVDTNNTAGFGAGAVVVLATQPTGGDRFDQEQYLYYSTDNGHTFTAYGAPVIDNPDGSDWFRDPKIEWDPANNNWVAVIGRPQSATFYTSTNLKNWTYKSTFSYTTPNLGGFECPDFFRIKADDGTWHWVFGASMQGDYSNLQNTYVYWRGTWNGTSFSPAAADPKWLGWGRDWYAAVTWVNQASPDTSRFATAWMNNWQYAPRAVQTDPSDDYNGQMSVTREITFVKESTGVYNLLSQPTTALDNNVSKTVSPANVTVNSGAPVDLEYKGVAYQLDVDVSWSSLNNVGVTVGQSADRTRGTAVGIFGGNSLYVDRAKSDQPTYTFGQWQKSESPIPATTSAHLKILVDRSSVEVFLDNGKITHSNTIYFKPGDSGISLYADGGSATFSNMAIKEFRDITNAAAPASAYADFEGSTYGSGWTTTGTAFGSGPAAGTLPNQQTVTGYQGSKLVNSFLGGDSSTGTLRTPNFTVNKPFVNFLVGGGKHPRPSDLYADFEGSTFGSGWTATGDFIGQGPNASGLTGQVGSKVLDTYVGGGDPATGTITSPSFTITRDYIDFLVAGGKYPWGGSGAQAVNLVVDGVVHRTATGTNSTTMAPVAWDVRELNGRTAQIQVVDNNAGDVWGHLAVDQILFTNGPGAVVGESNVQTTVNLVVGGNVVRTATGQDGEHLRWSSWNVSNLSGQTAYIEIIDNNTGGWGHIDVDHITLDDRRAS